MMHVNDKKNFMFLNKRKWQNCNHMNDYQIMIRMEWKISLTWQKLAKVGQKWVDKRGQMGRKRYI